MTNWKKHLAYGVGIEVVLTFGLFFSQYKEISYLIIVQLLSIMLISPLVMDLDHRNSKLREVFVAGGLISSMIGYYIDIKKLLTFSLPFTFVSFFICYLTKHRGIMHSIPFVILYGVGVYFLTKNINIGIIGGLGCYSHLFFDKEYFKLL